MVKLQDWLELYIHKDYAYLIVSGLIMIMQTLLLLLFGYIFNFIPFVLFSTIFVNSIRNYSYGFHLGTTTKFTILTSMLIIIFGYISRSSVSHLWAVFILYLYCVRDLYLNSPISYTDVDFQYRWYNTRPFIYIWKFFHINTAKYDTPYNLVWYRKGIIRWLVISLFLSVVLLYLNLYYFTNCILLSVIMCDMLLFLNKDEFL